MNQDTLAPNQVANEIDANKQPGVSDESLTRTNPDVAYHVAMEMKPFVDRAIEAGQQKDELLSGVSELTSEDSSAHSELLSREQFEAAADAADKQHRYEVLAEGVAAQKEAELAKSPLPTAEQAAESPDKEKVLGIDDIEPGSIVTFVHEDPDPTHRTEHRAVILAMREGVLDYVGIDKNLPDFGVASSKSFAEAGLSPVIEEDGGQAETHYQHTTGRGLRVPPEFHDKEEAANQLALLDRIEQTQQKYDAKPDHEPTIEGLATEALAQWTVEQKHSTNYQYDLMAQPVNIQKMAPEAQTPPSSNQEIAA